jgi:hypothetical protein
MSEEGKRWLILATDPFHDLQIDPTGYPDGNAERSVCLTYKLQDTIVRPSTVPATDNWDCHITIDDVPITANASHGNLYGNVFHTIPGTTYVPYGGCLARAGPVDTNLGVCISTDVETTALTLPTEIYKNKFRIVSQGFEIHNTTADLYKQGNITVYEQPLNIADEKMPLYYVTSVNDTLGGSSPGHVKPKPSPVNSAAAASILTGSHTWEAKDGAYIVGAMQDLDPRAKFPSVGASLFFDQDDINTTVPFAGWPTGGSTAHSHYPVDYGLDNVNSSIVEYNSNYSCRGAYLTGLSPETSLNLIWKVSIQIFPTYTSNYVALARPSPLEDKVAQMCYSEIMTRMPIGVRVAENGLGDWFSGAVANIIDTVTGTPIASKLDSWQKKQFSNSEQKTIEEQKKKINDLEKQLADMHKVIQAIQWGGGSKVPQLQQKTPTTRNRRVNKNTKSKPS